MITLIRKASKSILWVIVIVVVVTFAFWGDFTPSGRIASTTVGVIQGVPLDAKDFRSSLREATLGYFLSEGRLPSPGAEGEKLIQDRAWQRLLFLNEAKRYNIDATNKEVEKFLLRFPPFVTEGNFNPVTFDRFRRVLLPSIGISYRDFENMMHNDLLIYRTIDTLTIGVKIEEAQVDEQILRDHGIYNLLVLTLPLDTTSTDITVTDDILRPIYESRSEQFLEPEKRSFIVAEFSFEKDNPASRLEARDRAINFTISLIDEDGKPVEDFAGAAKQAAAVIRQINSVTADAKDENFVDLGAVLEEGFKLTEEIRDSNPLERESAFYVVRFLSASERKTLPFEQVRSQLEEEYRNQQALSRGFVNARKMREEILAELENGTDITTVANAKSLSTEIIEGFVPSQSMDTGDIDKVIFASTVANLKAGELSQPQNFRKGLAFFYVTSKTEPQDKERYRTDVKGNLYQQAKNLLLTEWLSHSQRSGSELKIK